MPREEDSFGWHVGAPDVDKRKTGHQPLLCGVGWTAILARRRCGFRQKGATAENRAIAGLLS